MSGGGHHIPPTRLPFAVATPASSEESLDLQGIESAHPCIVESLIHSMSVVLWREMCLSGQGRKQGSGALGDGHLTKALFFLHASRPFTIFLVLR